ncbi:unnamed protein product [Pipistrellus nathusii]|uniref:Uncharacterized protein n=1 Tax=Pipistrellus nathusii TaxID=59473 RepID=A0ABN9ZQJ6_PIPNA
MSKPSRSPQALNLLSRQRWLSHCKTTGALKRTSKTLWVIFKETRETLCNFGYSHGEDTGQAMSWGRSLANSSPNFSRVCPRQSQSQLSGEGGVSDHFSLLHNFSFGDHDNKLGFGNYAHFCVNKSNRTKNKTKAVGLSGTNAARTECGLGLASSSVRGAW